MDTMKYATFRYDTIEVETGLKGCSSYFREGVLRTFNYDTTKTLNYLDIIIDQ